MVKDRKAWKSVPFACFKVVEVVRRCNLDGACSEFQVDENGIAYDWNQAVRERETDSLADQSILAGVFRMDRHRGIAEHGFRPRGCDGETSRWILLERVVD